MPMPEDEELPQEPPVEPVDPRITLARWLISDKDEDNYLFTDDELLILIERNTLYRTLDVEAVDTFNKVFEIKTPYSILDTEPIKVIDGGTVLSPSLYTLNLPRHLLIFNESQDKYYYQMECTVLDEDNFRADAFEVIVTDFRKLQTYSIQTVNGNLDTAKDHLLKLIRHFRIPR